MVKRYIGQCVPAFNAATVADYSVVRIPQVGHTTRGASHHETHITSRARARVSPAYLYM